MLNHMSIIQNLYGHRFSDYVNVARPAACGGRPVQGSPGLPQLSHIPKALPFCHVPASADRSVHCLRGLQTTCVT